MDFPRPQSRLQACLWWLEDNAVALLACLAGAPIILPLAIYHVAAMAESAARPETYPFTGICPDCPTHDDANLDALP